MAGETGRASHPELSSDCRESLGGVGIEARDNQGLPGICLFSKCTHCLSQTNGVVQLVGCPGVVALTYGQPSREDGPSRFEELQAEAAGFSNETPIGARRIVEPSPRDQELDTLLCSLQLKAARPRPPQ